MSRLQKPRGGQSTYRWVGAMLFSCVHALSFSPLWAQNQAKSAPCDVQSQKPLSPEKPKKESQLCCPVDCPCRKGTVPEAHAHTDIISSADSTFLPGHSVDSQGLLWQNLEPGKAWVDDWEVNSVGVTGHLQTWEAFEGQGLKEALQSWADAMHWKLIWKASCNYPLVSTIRIYGSLDAAIEKLVSAYLYAEQPLRADIYPVQGLIVISNF